MALADIPDIPKEYTWYDSASFLHVINKLSKRAAVVDRRIAAELYSVVRGGRVFPGTLSRLQKELFSVAERFVDTNVNYEKAKYTTFPIYMTPNRVTNYFPELATVPEHSAVFSNKTRQSVATFLSAADRLLSMLDTVYAGPYGVNVTASVIKTRSAVIKETPNEAGDYFADTFDHVEPSEIETYITENGIDSTITLKNKAAYSCTVKAALVAKSDYQVESYSFEYDGDGGILSNPNQKGLMVEHMDSDFSDVTSLETAHVYLKYRMQQFTIKRPIYYTRKTGSGLSSCCHYGDHVDQTFYYRYTVFNDFSNNISEPLECAGEKVTFWKTPISQDLEDYLERPDGIIDQLKETRTQRLVQTQIFESPSGGCGTVTDILDYYPSSSYALGGHTVTHRKEIPGCCIDDGEDEVPFPDCSQSSEWSGVPVVHGKQYKLLPGMSGRSLHESFGAYTLCGSRKDDLIDIKPCKDNTVNSLVVYKRYVPVYAWDNSEYSDADTFYFTQDSDLNKTVVWDYEKDKETVEEGRKVYVPVSGTHCYDCVRSFPDFIEDNLFSLGSIGPHDEKEFDIISVVGVNPTEEAKADASAHIGNSNCGTKWGLERRDDGWNFSKTTSEHVKSAVYIQGNLRVMFTYRFGD